MRFSEMNIYELAYINIYEIWQTDSHDVWLATVTRWLNYGTRGKEEITPIAIYGKWHATATNLLTALMRNSQCRYVLIMPVNTWIQQTDNSNVTATCPQQHAT